MVGKSTKQDATKKLAKKSTESAEKTDAKPKSQSGEVVLLSGGNPQIAKGCSDAPMQAYIAAMPGWKRDVGRRSTKLGLPPG